MSIIVTGAAGFIGYSVCMALLQRGDLVTGIDSLNDYYDPSLKNSRLSRLEKFKNFKFVRLDIVDHPKLLETFKEVQPRQVLHLAAQAGVQYSLKNPFAYVQSNLVGFVNILEVVREVKCEHLIYASTSSVYGANTEMPFKEQHKTDAPLTLYAASKKANELLATSYNHLYGMKATGLRFFTVYGPWGRPDMALFKFTKNILEGKPVDLYNHGKHTRDFTYIDDLVEVILRIIDADTTGARSTVDGEEVGAVRHSNSDIYNIGSNNPIELRAFLQTLEQVLNRPARINYLELQPGDVEDTFANVDKIMDDFGYKPGTDIQTGIKRFVDWYLDYYGVPDPNHNIL